MFVFFNGPQVDAWFYCLKNRFIDFICSFFCQELSDDFIFSLRGGSKVSMNFTWLKTKMFALWLRILLDSDSCSLSFTVSRRIEMKHRGSRFPLWKPPPSPPLRKHRFSSLFSHVPVRRRSAGVTQIFTKKMCTRTHHHVSSVDPVVWCMLTDRNTLPPLSAAVRPIHVFH